jgi:hypothetical protein
MTIQSQKQDWLARIRAGRAELEAALARFDDARLADPFPPDGWSVKDVMAHIAFWEGYARARLHEASQGQAPQLLGDITQADVDRINQGALDAGRQQFLVAVQDDFRRAHAGLLAEIAAIPEDPDDPWWTLWPDRELPWLIIQYNTTDHYAEHLADVRRWLADSA